MTRSRGTCRMSGGGKVVAVLAVLFLISATGAEAQRRIPGDFYPGDGVRVIVWQDPTRASIQDLNIDKLRIADDYIIDRSGQILLPLIGKVQAVGKTQEALAEYLQERYSEFITGLYFVCKPLIRITILGAVNRPGSYLVERNASLWETISTAGGPTPAAELKKIYLTRSDKVVAENLLEVYEKAYSLQEIGVRSGDQIVVPPKGRNFIRTMLDYGSFVMSVAVLYLQIRRYSR